jgi:hypothetical protein
MDTEPTAPPGLLPTEGFYHWGIVAVDFEATCDELAAVCGLTWAKPMRRQFAVRQLDGVAEVDFRLTYSIEGPPHYEVLEASPGSVWDPSVAGGVHHLGFWSEDMAADAARLIAAGYPCGATADTPGGQPVGFSYHRLRSGLWVELVDIARKPAYDQWIAGGDFPQFTLPTTPDPDPSS